MSGFHPQRQHHPAKYKSTVPGGYRCYLRTTHLGGAWAASGLTLDAKGSSVQQGASQNLPTMKASVNAFTRLVFGVCPASGLAFTGKLSNPTSLLAALDRKLLLPKPDMDQLF